MLMSAPCHINSWATSVWLLIAAKCNGVSLSYRVCLFTSAPFCRRSLTTPVRLCIVARWRAFQSPPVTSTCIPFRNIRSTVLTSPSPAAWRKLLTRCSSVPRYEKRLDANKNEPICFHETYFNCIWNFAQMKSKSFWLENELSKDNFVRISKKKWNLHQTKMKWAGGQVKVISLRR